MKSRHLISAGFLVLAAVATAGWWVQRQHTAVLRDDVARIRQQNSRIGSVQAEHERLVRERVPVWELQRLRSDHAALGWLQVEVDALKAAVSSRERSAAQAATSPNVPAVVVPPALIVNLAITQDGTVLVDGDRSDLALLEQRMAALVRGSSVAVRISGDPAHVDTVRQTTRRLMAVAKEHGLRIEMTYGSR